jgi:hypothetical protein
LVRIAGALAFVSEPQEAAARFHWLMPALIGDWRWGDDSDRFSPRSFYLALAGLPPDRAASLLREYTKQQELSDPYADREFIDVLGRVGGTELAEWVFTEVADSSPSRDAYRNVPLGRPVYPRDLAASQHQEDISHEYLEAIFPHLGTQSIPLLLEYLDSENAPLRAFVVWRLTSLDYEWSAAQLRALQQDQSWKARLNSLFVGDEELLQRALGDRNGVVRVIAHVLTRQHKGAGR